jgi:hypothetical protein
MKTRGVIVAGSGQHLSQTLQILNVKVFGQIPLAELVAKNQSRNNPGNSHNQLMLCD